VISAAVERSLQSFDRPLRNFDRVLVAVIVAVIFQLSAPDTNIARLVSVLLQGAVVLFALQAAGARKKVIAAAVAFIGTVAAASALTVVAEGNLQNSGPRIGTLLLVLAAPAAIVIGIAREQRRDRRVTLQTVFGGLSLYLLIGLFFAVTYAVIQAVSGNDFFADRPAGEPSEFLYFSLVTLTTTGFGDFTAAHELGRALAATEALFGQIYLVTIVALLVSNLGKPRRDESFPRRRPTSGES
jgi:peptidoglycan/LPS O-acetylase OafA/YrhL